MEKPDVVIHKARILLSCKREKDYTSEFVMDQHGLAHIISGELTFTYGNQDHVFHPGDTVIIPGRQLGRLKKTPANNEPYQSLSIFFPGAQLRAFYAAHPVAVIQPKRWGHLLLEPHPLLESFFTSLLPYFELQDELATNLAEIKIQECLTILNELSPQARMLLSDFQEAGKADLADYMEQNFMYNLPLEKFSSLTGRSLTTFKKDFKTIFQTTPGKWLLEKRLELAHFQLSTQKRKPSEVYLDAGFENLSHFSFTFKKKFGYSPAKGM